MDNNIQQTYEVPKEYIENKGKSGKGLAIASLVLGILAIVTLCITFVSAICSIISIILGIIALKKRTVYKSIVIAGFVCSGLALIITVALLIIMMIVGTVQPATQHAVPNSMLFQN